jgi:hypothetical protein
MQTTSQEMFLRRVLLFLCYGSFLIGYAFVQEQGFFWDTVQLGAKHAHWYYEQNFQHILLPEAIDSGHPPIFGMYLALCWKLFGYNLAVSHFAILPFTLTSLFFLHRIGSYFLGKKNGVFLVILLLADPTFTAQNLLISPDACLMTFLFGGIYATLRNSQVGLLLASVGLAMISMRGMMVVVVLYIWILICAERQPWWRAIWREAIPFIPSGVLALFFLVYHYFQVGWIGYHSDSPWAESFVRVEVRDFLRNAGVYMWRLLDFGRISGMLVLVILLFLNRNLLLLSFRSNKKFKKIVYFLAISLLLLSPSLLLYKHLSAHRYFLPIFFGFHLLTIYLLFEWVGKEWRKWIFSGWIILLFSGNLWLYPASIAQGWDASLAFLPYDQLRRELLHYIGEEKIDLREIGTVFPEVGARKYRELDGQLNGFKAADLANDQYIFYSNVMNDFSDEELEVLQRHWKVKKKYERLGIQVILYESKRLE